MNEGTKFYNSLHILFMMQATHINFICPMRFDTFPLDTQVWKLCKTNLKRITFLDLDVIKPSG